MQGGEQEWNVDGERGESSRFLRTHTRLGIMSACGGKEAPPWICFYTPLSGGSQHSTDSETAIHTASPSDHSACNGGEVRFMCIRSEQLPARATNPHFLSGVALHPAKELIVEATVSVPVHMLEGHNKLPCLLTTWSWLTGMAEASDISIPRA